MYWRKASWINSFILNIQEKKYWLDEYWEDNYSWDKVVSKEEIQKLINEIDNLDDNLFDTQEEDKKQLQNIIDELWEDEELTYSASR